MRFLTTRSVSLDKKDDQSINLYFYIAHNIHENDSEVLGLAVLSYDDREIGL